MSKTPSPYPSDQMPPFPGDPTPPDRDTRGFPSETYPDPDFSAEIRMPTPEKRYKKKAVSKWDIEEKVYSPEIDELEVMTARSPSDAEDFDTVRESFKVYRTNERTIVFAISVDLKEEENNAGSAIRCFGGTAFGGYAHDQTRDASLIRCVDFLQIGILPFGFVATMPGVGDWQVHVPIPAALLDKSFTPAMRKTLEDYRNRYPSPRYGIQYIQMLGCN